MSRSRNSIGALLASDRLVAAAAVVALAEALLRLGLAIRIDPLAVVLWPPFVAVTGLAWAVPSVRTVLIDAATDAATPTGTDRFLDRLPSLAAVAVGGHALAVALGTTLFLLVDTAVRYLLYLTGYGDLLGFEIIALTPLFGVTAGTFVAWIVPAIAVVRVADGASASHGLRDAVVASIRTPRRLERPFLCHYGFVCPVLVALFVVGSRTKPAQWSMSLFGSNALVVTFAVVGLLAVFGAALWLALSLVLTLERDESTGDRSSARGLSTVSLERFAVGVLVLSTLVVGVGVVRVGEIRPMDTSPEPLPDDPDELYATAFENTQRASHEYRYFDYTKGTEPTQVVRVDREDRRIVLTSDGDVTRYGSMGTMTPTSVRLGDEDLVSLGTVDAQSSSAAVVPGYPYFEGRAKMHGEPSETVDGWTVRERTDDEIVLELDDPDDVYAAMTGHRLEALAGDLEIHESWARATVDAERGTLSTVEFRLEMTQTTSSETEREHETHVAYEYEPDVDAERPDELGDPGPGEWLWKLFAY